MPLRSFTQAELILTERRRLERPLLVMVWLAVAAFSLAEGNLFYLLAATLAVTVNLLAVMRKKELYVKRVFVNIGVVVAMVVLLLEVRAGRQAELVVVSHLLILILLCKLFEQKRNRDYVQMVVMSLLLMMSASLICDAIWMGAMLVVFLALTCHTTMVFTLKRGLDAAASARLATEPAPLPPQRVAWNVLRNWPERTLRRLVVLSTAGILVAGIVAFLVIPREVGGGIGLLGQTRSAARSGFSRDVELGQAHQIYLSERIVMRVQLSKDGKPVVAPGPVAYLRGRTFDRYRRSRWTTSAGSASRVRLDDGLVERIGWPPKDALVQKISMVPRLAPTLFACYPAIAIEAPHERGRASIDVDTALNYALTHPASQEGPVRYTAYSWTAPLTRWQRQLLGRLRAQLEHGAIEPREQVEVSPPVAVLARQWCQDLLAEREALRARRDRGDPRAARQLDELNLRIARRITKRLQQRCGYTLDLSEADSQRDAIEDFLFHTKRGHCEYFASALAVMCSSLGLRARLASGFHLSEPGADGMYIVRERNAHAWTEVFTPGTDWVTIDPSPRAHRAPPSGWWQSLKRMWHSLEFSWYEAVAGYDAISRSQFLGWLGGLLKPFGDAAEAVWRGLTKLPEALRGLLVHGRVDRALLVFIAVIGALALAVETLLILRAVRRRRRLPWAQQHLAVPVWQLAFIADLFGVLQRRGLRLEPAQTALAAARAAAARFDLPADVLTDLVDLYYRLRWGGRAATDQEIRTAEDRVGQIRRILSARGKVRI